MFEESGVRDVVLPDSLRLLGDLTFSLCERLVSVDLPASLETIGEECFSFSGLRSIPIPGSVRTIGR